MKKANDNKNPFPSVMHELDKFFIEITVQFSIFNISSIRISCEMGHTQAAIGTTLYAICNMQVENI